MTDIVTDDHRQAAMNLRKLLAKYKEIELLVRIGEYKQGADVVADEAIAKVDRINDYLKQGLKEEVVILKDAVEGLKTVFIKILNELSIRRSFKSKESA